MDIRDYTFIVFSEEQHYNPLGVVRSLGEYGINPITVGYGKGLHVVCHSKYVKEAYHVRTIGQGYELILEKFRNPEQKAFIITCDDRATQYLDERYDELKDYFYFDNAGKNGGVTYYMNKNNINVLAEKYGLKVPKAFVVERGEIREDFEYPVITKAITSNTGAWKKDVFVCQNAEELKAAYEKIKSDTLLIQHYLEKTNELCFDGFSVNHGKDVFFAISSLYNYNIPGKFAFDYTSENPHDKELMDALSAMLREIGFEGIFSIEFLIDKNQQMHFMEINFRNSTWSYTATKAGMNLPVSWAKGMLEGRIPNGTYRPIKEGGIRTLAEFDDFKARVAGKKMNIRDWFKIAREADCLLFFNKEDNKPFWICLFDKFNRIKRIKHR